MADTPNEAPVAPEAKSEATPNTNPEPAKEQAAPAAPDMHGFTSEQLADMQKFFQANGGYDKVKSKISNPTPAPAEEQKPVEPEKPVEAQVEQPEYKRPQGALTQQEYFTKRYFFDLAEEQKYAGIAKEIINGDIIKEMDALGIPYQNIDGSINEDKVRPYLDLKAKTVPAKQTEVMPESSAAPTVDYVPVGDKINSMEEARAIITQDAQLRRSGQAGHPNIKMAEDYLRDVLSQEKK